MTNINGLLEEVTRRIEISRKGISIYHAVMGAGENGQKVERDMLETEIKLLTARQRLVLIQLAADIGNLADVQRLLAEEITINIPQTSSQAKPT